MKTKIAQELIDISRRCVPFMAVGLMFAGLAYQYGQGATYEKKMGFDRYMTISSVMLP